MCVDLKQSLGVCTAYIYDEELLLQKFISCFGPSDGGHKLIFHSLSNNFIL